MHVLDILEQRGFVKQSTDQDALRKALDDGPLTFYVGFDPTGDCLHVGHLVPVMVIRWLQEAGHRPIIVLGGGTAMVGDPSGKDKTREMISAETIQHNLEAQRAQFGRFLDLSKAEVVNNADWLMGLEYVTFLRDIGRHFSVNKMLSAEGVRQRLDRNQGLSFIEFNYHLLQSFDFLKLNETYGCSLQVGGDDQWFHILGGVDLIRRVNGGEAHGLTVPLLTRADGKKMGKTETGAVWIDAERFSPYDYYQYWVNVHDADVGRFLRMYTVLPIEEIVKLEALDGADIRKAKQVLAFEATKLAHGEQEATAAQQSAKKVFGGAGIADEMPTHQVAFPIPVFEVLADSGLCKSRGAARRLIQQGGARIGDTRVTDVHAMLDGPAVVWAGKKRAVRVEQK